MSPRARFVAALCAAAAFAATALLAVRSEWWRLEYMGRAVQVPGLPVPATLPGDIDRFRGSDIVPTASVLLALALLGCILALLIGPQGRRTVLTLAAGCAAAAALVSATAGPPPSARGRGIVVQSATSGRLIAVMAAVGATFFAAAAVGLAGRVPRLGMPERAGDEAPEPTSEGSPL